MNKTRTIVEISIDKRLCTNCLRCQVACPVQLFVVRRQEAKVDPDARCITCGHCVSVCSVNALSHSLLPPDAFQVAEQVSPDDGTSLVRILKGRRSCRRFLPESVPDEDVQDLLNIAGYAPTSTNRQDIRFEVLKSPEQIARLVDLTASFYGRLWRHLSNPLLRLFMNLIQGRQKVQRNRARLLRIRKMLQQTGQGSDRLFYGAPLVLVVHGGGMRELALANVALASMHILLQAHAKGLGTCLNGYAQLALLKDRRALDSMGISRDRTAGAVIALGYPHMEYHLIPPRGSSLAALKCDAAHDAQPPDR